MDYLQAQYPPKLIREKLGLNDRQIDSALAYIETHCTEGERNFPSLYLYPLPTQPDS
jgi:hypothetical protein